MADDNRTMNYYFAEEFVPKALQADITWPHILDDYLVPNFQAYWHGIGTVSLPHTDSDENIMCVIKGYKNFTIVSPLQSKFVYAGVGA